MAYIKPWNCHWLYGRDCQLGYGLDVMSRVIYPFEHALEGILEGVIHGNQGVYLFVSELGDQQIHTWPGLNPFLTDMYLQWLDNHILMSQERHFLVDLCVCTRNRRVILECGSYPEPVTATIYRIDYGVDISIVVPGQAFEDGQTVRELFVAVLEGTTTLTEAQQHLKCGMLVNFTHSYSISLKHVFRLVEDVKGGRQPQCECAVLAHFKVMGHIPDKAESSDLGRVVSYLYICYRKIEMRAAKMDYNLSPVGIDSLEKDPPHSEVLSKFKRAKLDYQCMDRSDFLDMYPVIKRLVLWYRTCLRLVIHNDMPLEALTDTPATIGEMKNWLRTLNSWTPHNGCDHY